MKKRKVNQSKPFYISIAGNIGSGKTTLTQKLTNQLGWQPLFENFAQNPYLDRFYADMNRWGFHSQLFFLTERLKQNKDLIDRKTHLIQDRSIYEDAEIFAKNLHKQGQIPAEDFHLYSQLYDTMKNIITPPHLIVYLRNSVDTLVKRIEKRGREFEQQISRDYLGTLNELYEEWIGNFSLCPTLAIDTDNLNIVESKEDVEQIKAQVLNFLV